MTSPRSDLHIALCSAASAANVALCASIELAATAEAPEWVHLLPAGEIRTGDGRGPYRVVDAAALCAASLSAGEKLVLDENHATDLAAPRGESAPARGWIVELQPRTDGVWGKVEWTAHGRRLVAGRSYRGISPVITHRQDGLVTGLLRASLVNKPNLRGLTALHSSQEKSMDLLAKLLTALGLPATTSEETLLTAITAMHAQQAKASTALQAALDPIGVAIGLQAGADASAVLAGVQQLKAGAGDAPTIVALQQEITTLGTQLATLKTDTARKAATAFVDAAIRAGTVSVKPLRDHYIARHMENPAQVETEINAFPKLGPSGTSIVPPAPANGEIALQAEDSAVARLLGIAPKAMAGTIQAEREAAL